MSTVLFLSFNFSCFFYRFGIGIRIEFLESVTHAISISKTMFPLNNSADPIHSAGG